MTGWGEGDSRKGGGTHSLQIPALDGKKTERRGDQKSRETEGKWERDFASGVDNRLALTVCALSNPPDLSLYSPRFVQSLIGWESLCDAVLRKGRRVYSLARNLLEMIHSHCSIVRHFHLLSLRIRHCRARALELFECDLLFSSWKRANRGTDSIFLSFRNTLPFLWLKRDQVKWRDENISGITLLMVSSVCSFPAIE